MKMAKAKRPTRAEPTTTRPTMAGLQEQIDAIARSHNAAALSIQSVQRQFDNLAKHIDGQSKQAASQSDDAAEKVKQLAGRVNRFEGVIDDYSTWSWAPVGIIALAISIFLGVQRGCNHGSPTPAPDENEQSIIEPAKAKKLVGTVIFVHDRDPMSPADVALLQACEDLADSREDFEFKSYDSVDDKSAKVANYKSKAKDKGIDPPFMLNIVGDKASFAPMATDFAGVVKVFGK